MRVVIIEDEEPAARRLSKILKEVLPSSEVVTILESVKGSLKWFHENRQPDLVLSDIQLNDGTSFDIFRKADISCPVIFTTAFDQYAIEAFKLNSIDYLLKPIKKEELSAAINKFLKSSPSPALDLAKVLQNLAQPANFKQRFVVKYGEHLKTITTGNIAYFTTEDKVNFLVTREGRRYAIDLNLDSLENSLDPKMFFRINRQFIISISSISEMFAYSKSRVLIKLDPPARQETIVSSERSAQFKAWLDDNN